MSGTTGVSTPAEMRALVLEAESLLFRRLDTTADPAERRSLVAQVEALNVQKDALTLALAIDRTAALNALSDVLVDALANVRTQPLNGIASQIESLLGRVGQALGLGQPRTDAPEPGLEATPPPRPRRTPAPGPEPGPAVPSTVAGNTSDPRVAKEYKALFDSCAIRPEHEGAVRADVARLVNGAPVYQKLADALGGRIPWYFIGIVHGLECSFSFEKHLHNGDPLRARTMHEPAGRPQTGSPPFTFAESALDAIRMKGLDDEADWGLADMLFRWEGFNGFGYRSRGMNSPYLWSFSNHYTRGKFIADKVFDASVVSKQCGTAVTLKGLVLHGAVTLEGGPDARTRRAAPAPASAAVLGAGVAALLPAGPLPRHVAAEVEFPGQTGPGSTNEAAVRRVQEWCTFQGFATGIDGDFGTGASGAVRDFQARRGIPATGSVDARTWAALTAPLLRVLADAAPAGPGLHGMVAALAAQHLQQHPVEVGGDNRGPWVRLYMDGKDGDPQQWCAGFLCFVIEQAALRTGTGMPFRRQVGCDALVADAKRDGRFVAGDELRTPAARISRLPPGTVFAIRQADNPGDYIHAGLVSEAGGDRYRTVEGNTNQTGSERGFEVTENSRRYQNVDFLLLS